MCPTLDLVRQSQQGAAGRRHNSTISVVASSLPNSEKPVDACKQVLYAFDPRRSTHQQLCQRLLKLRFQLCLFLCFAMFCTTFANFSLNVTILCMTKPLSRNLTCCGDSSNGSSANDSGSSSAFTFDWSMNKQNLIQSAFNWGRLLAPFTGMLTDKMDNGQLLEISLITCGLASTLLPFSSSKSFAVAMALRVLTGIGDAVLQPCINRFVAQWYSEKTRTNAFGWATAGRQLGTLIVYPVSGILCTLIHVIGGWPMVFYLGGACCVIWTLLFHLFKVLRLRKREKMMLTHAKHKLGLKTNGAVPWRKVLLSPAFWANLGAILCHEIPVNVVFVFLPRYIRDVMKVGIQFNSLLSTLPVACFLISKIISSQLDHVIKCKFANVDATRLSKVFNAIACIGLATFLLCASFLRGDQIVLAMVSFCLSAASAGLHTPGCLGTLVTMAPTFTGSLSGFAYFFISLSSIINPQVVGLVVVRETASEWSMVFQGASAIAILPLIFFTLWGSAAEQSWHLTNTSDDDSSSPSSSRTSISTISCEQQ